MRSILQSLLSVAVGFLICLTPVDGFSTTIDFETPSLGSLDRQIIDPFVDPITGVVFHADEALPAWTEVVGLVRNSATSACVPPSDANQKLGTGTAESGLVGVAGLPIIATFPVVLAPPAYVSVEVQALAGTPVELTLYDEFDNILASTVETTIEDAGVCAGFPGGARAKITVGVSSGNGVAKARIEQLGYSVFIMDDFTFLEDDAVCGDMDGDREVTETDLLLLRDAYFSGDPDLLFWPQVADWDCDGTVRINDVILMAGFVYGYSAEPCCGGSPKREEPLGRDAFLGAGR